MKLSEAITHRIVNDAIGQSVGRDEKGLYIEWDSLELRPNGDLVLKRKGVIISTQSSFFHHLPDGSTILITGLEGRIRVVAD